MITYSPNAWALTDIVGLGLMGLSFIAFAIVVVLAARQLRR